MRNMSFALTKEQIKNQTKFVTRRFGWWFLRPGDRVQPVEKCMGFKKGESIVKIGGPIEIVDVRAETECADFGVDEEECVLEGFPEMSPEEFIKLLKKLQKNDGDPCNRIQFKYLQGR